jgi:MFS family permease|tara:strand:- start:737 stop:1009 length:273 start_codon:yes stop_codon:yes gene_type:complete
MRASASAFYLAMTTFLGLSSGPYLIGYLSDNFAENGMSSAEALRQSLQLGLLAFVVVIVFSVLLKRHLLVALETRQERAHAAGEPIHAAS